MHFFLLLILFFPPLCATWEKTVYPLTTNPIDVVIPCSPKDLETLNTCIECIQKNGVNVRRIIVISEQQLTQKAEWFDEAQFPFNKKEVALEIFRGDERGAEDFLSHPKTRIGWIYQQLLKFYAPFTIPDLSPNILILDADVFFIKPTPFLGEHGEPLFAFSREQTQEYFDHASRLLPTFKRVHPGKSGVVHHMLFQKPILTDLLQTIAQHHQTEPWKAIVHCIASENLLGSSMSEYEIYFNFAFLRTEQATLRRLRSLNIAQMRLFPIYAKHDYDFLTCHSWARDFAFLMMEE